MPETKLLQTSPKRAFSAISSSSRRSHPSESKSLPRSKRVKIQNSPENTQTTNPETADDSVVPIPSLTSIIPQEKSQESSSDQSASRWFDKANENVGQAGKRSSKHEGKRFPMSPWFPVSVTNLTTSSRRVPLLPNPRVYRQVAPARTFHQCRKLWTPSSTRRRKRRSSRRHR